MIHVDTPTLTLPGGAIPVLGLGTWQAQGGVAERAVSAALQLGYRHIDTATMYRNEAEVGRALATVGIDRDDVFVTTKLPPGTRRPGAQTLTESLVALNLDHLDLWLVHWPPGGRRGAARRGRRSAPPATRGSSARSASRTTRSPRSTS